MKAEQIKDILLGINMTDAYDKYVSVLKQNFKSEEKLLDYWKSDEKVHMQANCMNEIISKKEELERLIKETKESLEEEDGIEDASYAMYLAGKAELWVKLTDNVKSNQEIWTKGYQICKKCRSYMTEEDLDDYFLKEETGNIILHSIYTDAKKCLEAIALQIETLSELKDKSQINTLTFEI
ncbi:MAG: hypothetical protein M0P12_02170 [Paludibacteraceae bacterium]|jgi:hypothetical protein|nr:hypothetical protein [Paludibacteraceae bacterium]HOU68415.1 hypothetical protein [Paludibacteraceae bacterium]